jgi:hypothetical protein
MSAELSLVLWIMMLILLVGIIVLWWLYNQRPMPDVEQERLAAKASDQVGLYPKRYPGPWLGPLSIVVRHTPVSPPSSVGLVGTSFGLPRWSDGQHVPVPMQPHATETGSAQ